MFASKDLPQLAVEVVVGRGDRGGELLTGAGIGLGECFLGRVGGVGYNLRRILDCLAGRLGRLGGRVRGLVTDVLKHLVESAGVASLTRRRQCMRSDKHGFDDEVRQVGGCQQIGVIYDRAPFSGCPPLSFPADIAVTDGEEFDDDAARVGVEMRCVTVELSHSSSGGLVVAC